MADTKGVAPANTESGFRLTEVKEGLVALVVVGKKAVHLNLGTRPTRPLKNFPNGVPVADQATMKMVYDAGPEMKEFVTAPDGYKAPWQK